MNKAEQPTTQANYTVADYELAEKCVSAANVVTCDGYYEVDIEKVAETLAKSRTTSLAAQDGLVEAVAEALLSAFLAGRGSVTADGRKAYKPAPSMADFRNIALSAIKEQHHD